MPRYAYLLIAPLVTVSLITACDSATAPHHRPGDRLWVAPPNANLAPAADSSSVYFLTNDHQVVAVRRSDGSQRWSAATGMQTPWYYGADLRVAGSIVIVPDWDVFAFDTRTGSRLWAFGPENDQLPGKAPGSWGVDVDDSTVFTGGAGHAYAVNLRTGVLRWITTIASPDSTSIVGHPIADGSRVFVSLNNVANPPSGAAYALDRSTGAILWSRPFPPNGSGTNVWSMVVANGFLIVSVGDGTVHALSEATGSDVWVAPRLADVVERDDVRELAAVGNLVVAGSTAVETTAFDATTGAVVWQHDLQEGSIIVPIASDSANVYMTFANGRLLSVRASDGHVNWTALAPDPNWGFGASPLATATAIYAPSNTGLVAIQP